MSKLYVTVTQCISDKLLNIESIFVLRGLQSAEFQWAALTQKRFKILRLSDLHKIIQHKTHRESWNAKCS